jgi:hypothetical protein
LALKLLFDSLESGNGGAMKLFGKPSFPIVLLAAGFFLASCGAQQAPIPISSTNPTQTPTAVPSQASNGYGNSNLAYGNGYYGTGYSGYYGGGAVTYPNGSGYAGWNGPFGGGSVEWADE